MMMASKEERIGYHRLVRACSRSAVHVPFSWVRKVWRYALHRSWSCLQCIPKESFNKLSDT